jgi:hypothetical protein
MPELLLRLGSLCSMPHYFLDIRDHEGLHQDVQGADFPDLEAAKLEARRTLADMAKDAIRRSDHTTIAIEIRVDAHQPELLVIAMSSVIRSETEL